MNQSRYDHIGDQDLLHRYLQDRDNAWLGILLERYTLLLFGVCMKYLKDETQAQDAVQQIFLKVIQEVHKYKIDYFKSWLYTVAKNHCLTVLRDKKRNIPVALTENDQLADQPDEAPEKEAISPELLKDALDALSEEQRQSVILFYLKKKSYQEISASEGYSLLQVKSYIQNGKRNLKLLIQKMLKKAKKENG